MARSPDALHVAEEALPDAWFAGVELGGTKTIAVLAQGDTIVQQVEIPTRAPSDTLPPVRQQIAAWHAERSLAGIGIASFGPLQLQPREPGFGHLLGTPKRGWAGADVVGAIRGGIDAPWQLDTDVNGAALAEYRWGAGQGHDSLCYVTLGTGVGGGLLIDGKPVHGAMHPEIGHLRLRRSAGDDFTGICSFHQDCIEGLVSGPALAARFGTAIEAVTDDDPRWDQVAADLAEMVAALLMAVAPQAILFGGGVSTKRPFLISRIRSGAIERLGGYLPFVNVQRAVDAIRLAGLGELAGPLGAIALAQAAATRTSPD